MSPLAIFRNLLPTARNSRRRAGQSISVDQPALRSLEDLEQRALLTVGIDFNFQVIASDLSADLRLFGSNDQADAPLEVIRFGSGTVTGLSGLSNTNLLSDPMDLTFEIGSMDVNNPVEVLKLDRNQFDDGVNDGVANQIYLPADDSEIRFFYQGNLLGRASFQRLELNVTPQGVTTGIGNMGLIHEALPDNQDHAEIRRLINQTFSVNGDGDASRPREFTLGTFTNDGTWAGVADARIFSSSASMVSSDDLSDSDQFGAPWDLSSPFTGESSFDNDDDWLITNLDPTQEHTFRIDATVGGGIVDFTSDFFSPGAIINFDGRVLNQDGQTWVTVRPQSPRTNIVISPNPGASYTVTHLSSEPTSFNVYYLDDMLIAWTPELDELQNPLPADGYRVELSNSAGVFDTIDVGSDTMQLSLDGLLGITSQQLRVGRIVNGDVVSWSEPEALKAIDQRPEITGFDGRTISWTPVPGAEYYDVYLDGQNYRFTQSATSYTLPDDHPIGWRQAWVRASSNRFSWTGWSRPLNYHARSRMASPTIDQSTVDQPTISWDSLAGADNYELYITRTNIGDPFIINLTDLTGTSWTPNSPMSLGTYRVWIRGVNAASGIAGTWSPVTAFHVGPVAESATGTRSELTFTWSNPPGVASVDLYILNGGNIIRRDGLTGTTWTETHDFENGRVTWWLRANDGSGGTTRWTEPSMLRVGSTEFTSHSEGVFTAGYRAFLNWLPVAGATSYEVYIRSETEVTVLYETGLSETTFRTSELPGNRYTFWVNTIREDGTNAWSRSFSIDVRTGSTRIITTRSGIAASNTPTIEWVADLTRTRLWVRNETTNTNQQIFTQDDGNTYTFTQPLAPGTYRIWASRWTSLDWGNSVVLIVADAEEAQELDQPATLLAEFALGHDFLRTEEPQDAETVRESQDFQYVQGTETESGQRIPGTVEWIPVRNSGVASNDSLSVDDIDHLLSHEVAGFLEW